jgi:glycosyltransferase involved in cell wall biosynthesis
MTDLSRVAVLIPALNEATTIGQVVRVARRARAGTVLVIDDGSTDATAAVARRAGAEVLRLERNLGKGGALAAGARHQSQEVVVLLDADLIGLRPLHIRALVGPVLRNEAEMTRGVFIGGRWATSMAQKLMPVLNGQRALRRHALLAVEDLDGSRYGVEVAISEHARRGAWRTVDVPLAGVSQVMKEEKRGPWIGLMVRMRMYREIILAFLRSVHSKPTAQTDDQRKAPKR